MRNTAEAANWPSISVVAEAADLDRKRLLKWIIAWAGVSAVWIVEDGKTAVPHTIDLDLAIVSVRHAECFTGQGLALPTSGARVFSPSRQRNR
jgi:hypothetical protein